MKLVLSIGLTVLSCSSFAQSKLRATKGLQLEWKKEFIDKYASPTGLLIENNSLYFSLSNLAYKFSLLGDQEASFGGGYMMEWRDGRLYFAGGPLFTVFNEAGSEVKKVPLLGDDNSHASAIGATILYGGLYTITDYNYLLKYDLNGNYLFNKKIGDLATNKFIKSGGQFIYVVSHISQPELGTRLIQYDTLGNQKWSLAPDMVNNILADYKGNCYVFVVVPQKSSIVRKYSPQGQLIWSKEVPGQVIANGSLVGDTLFVCGIESIEAANGQQQNPAYTAMSVKDGKILWQQTLDFYEGDEGYNEYFSHIVYHGKFLYLGGRTGAQAKKCFLIKLSPEGHTTSLNDATASRQNISIFPNPGGSKFTITCEGEQTGTTNVTVRNIAGQVVYQKTLSCNPDKSFTLDMGKQPAGNYTVEMKLGAETVAKKIIVE